MKKNFYYSVLLSVALLSCSTQDDVNNTIYEQNQHSESKWQWILRLSEQIQNNAANYQRKSIEHIIQEAEYLAFQDPMFLNLVDENYSTPTESEILSIIEDSDLVLQNTSLSKTSKDYVSLILQLQDMQLLYILTLEIEQHTQISSKEKEILHDVIYLHTFNKGIGNGDGKLEPDDDDWDKKKIIGYIKGYETSEANAVLNFIIINYNL